MKDIDKGYENWIGIYYIKCLSTGNMYIGSSINIRERWQQHVSLLRRGTHHSTYLQNSWNKYGEDNFEFGVLLRLFEDNEEVLRKAEWSFIDQYKPKFNIASPVIYSRTDEWREKISRTTKQLYENGYVNPRKDTGRRYKLMDKSGTVVANNLTVLEVCDYIGYNPNNYRNINYAMRKYRGFFYNSKTELLICDSTKTLDDLRVSFKIKGFADRIKPITSEGRELSPQEWFEGSYSHTWKKKVLESENLIVYINDKFITFPFLLPCDEETHHIITPEYHQKLKEETPMPI